MNNNPLLGQVLGGLFGQAMQRRGVGLPGGGLGGGLGGALGGGLGGIALGSVLGGMLGGARGGTLAPQRGGSNRSALLLMLLPLAMRWVQRNGGVGAVLDRFRQQGLDKQAKSWVSTQPNEPLDPGSVEQVVGPQELAQMAQRLGVPEHEVAQAFAEIMPEMVNQLSPQGAVPGQADEVLDEGRKELEKHIEDVQFRELRPS